MSVSPELLTAAALLELAGQTAFSRGREYAESGRVQGMEVKEEFLVGRVRGTKEYDVALYEEDGELCGDCTCPVGEDGEFCKHQVALGIAWLARGTASPATVRDVEVRVEDLAAPRSESALVEWALSRTEPIQAVSEALAAHPGIARVGSRLFTARILSTRLRLVVTVLPDEARLQVFVPGHRLVAMAAPGLPPWDVTMFAPGGKPMRSFMLEVPEEFAEVSHGWLPVGERGSRAMKPRHRSVKAFSLEGIGLHPGKYSLSMLVVKCLDFDRRHYELGPLTKEEETAALVRSGSALTAALRAVVDDPPPGPQNAPRQSLHALASLWDLMSKQPIGPLGHFFDRIPLIDYDGRAVYVDNEENPNPRIVGADGPAEAPIADATNPAAALLRAVDAAHAKLSGARDTGQVRLRNFEWDPVRSLLTASAEAYWPGRVQLFVEPPHEPLRTSCACGNTPEWCIHLKPFLREAARVLRSPGHPAGEGVRRALSRPAWSFAMERMKRALEKKGKPGSVAGEERIQWRLAGTGLSPLSIGAAVRKRAKKGEWSSGRLVEPHKLMGAGRSAATAQDMDVVRAAQRQGCAWSGGQPALLVRNALVEVLEVLAGHPDVTWDGGQPVRVEKGELHLRLERAEGGASRVVAEAGGVRLVAGAVAWFGTGGLAIMSPDRARLVVAPADDRAVEAISHVAGVDFDADGTRELLAVLPMLESVAPVELPEDLAGAQIPASDRLLLRLALIDGALTAALFARPFPGAPLHPPGAGPALVRAERDGKRIFAKRDLANESALASEAARALGLDPFVAKWDFPVEADALSLMERLHPTPPGGLDVEWADEKKRWTFEPPGDLRVRVADRRDWFGIDGGVDVNGETVPLGALIEALRANRKFVPLSAGRWLAITAELRERLGSLADLARPGKGPLEVPRLAAPLLDALDDRIERACDSWKRLRAAFDAASRIEPSVPATLAAELRDYQVDGFRWLARLAAWGAGACLADDMGLGKTVQALAALIGRAPLGPALVVAPTSVGTNWMAEAAKFAPTLRPVLYRETERGEAPAFAAGDLVVVSYGLALRDADRIAKVEWATLILDEAQFVKNARTKTAAAIARIPAAWRLALTGTPVENHLGDLWSLFHALNPGFLGSWDSFRERFAAPIERDKDAVRRAALARLVRPFILRRTKAEVLQELPARTEIVLHAELSPSERTLYDQARLLAAAKFAKGSSGDPKERIQILAALTRLRQLACHPRLVLPEAPPSSAKLRLLMETVADLRAGRHRALVFSQFTSYLAIVREALDAEKIPYQYLDGSTPPKARDAAVAAFQRGEGDLFLISLKAGGTGLNLTAADYVLILDPWWNPAVEDQAADRAHRIGQTRPVTIYRLVAADTIEDRILALHASKRELIAGVLAGADAAAKLSSQDLIALIREERTGG